MSTVPVPVASSASLLRRAPRLTAQARALLTTMNLHFAGVAALAVLNLYLMGHLFFVWRAMHTLNQDALDAQRNQLRAAEIAAKPLRGLDAKLVASTRDADAFYAQRLPYADSQLLAELGALTKKAGVHLSRVQYPQNPVLSGQNELTEVHMDASISGDYRPVVQFINSVERDRMFFVINGINLTGQQTGQVNLRIRLTTYLRQPVGDEMMGAPAIGAIDTAAADGSAEATR
jgi:type IV pilus assembly protein PilO